MGAVKHRLERGGPARTQGRCSAGQDARWGSARKHIGDMGFKVHAAYRAQSEIDQRVPRHTERHIGPATSEYASSRFR